MDSVNWQLRYTTITTHMTFFHQAAWSWDRRWGWGAMLLPFVEQSNLYDDIDFHVGTAVGTNVDLIRRPVSVWRCPSDIGPQSFATTLVGAGGLQIAHGNYAANGEVMAGLTSVSLSDISDGLSNTIMLGERAWNPDPAATRFTSAWFGTLASATNAGTDSIAHIELLPDRPINFWVGGGNCFSSFHAGGAHLALGDGSARFVSEDIDSSVFAAAGTIAGGEQTSL